MNFIQKANALRPGTVDILKYAAHNAGTGIIIHNDFQHFSAGVDLNHFRFLIENKNWEEIDLFLKEFQGVVTQLKYLPVPVIGVPSGLAIGGGFEVLAHCDALVHTLIRHLVWWNLGLVCCLQVEVSNKAIYVGLENK